MTRIPLAALAVGVLVVLGDHPPVLAQTPPTPPAAPTPPSPPALDHDNDHKNFSIKVGDEDLDPEIIKKLTPEQLESILLARSNHKDSSLESFGVPLAFFIFLGVVIGLRLYLSHRRDMQRYETLRFMVEKGTQIPPELIQPPAPRRNDLRRGLLLVGTGIGLSLFFAISHIEDHAWSAGFIPLLIGAGYLVAWKLEQKNVA